MNAQVIDSVDDYIKAAHDKLETKTIAEIARHIPDENGYRTHHLTLVKMPHSNPELLKSQIGTHIIDKEAPEQYPSVPRAKKTKPRQTKKVNISLKTTQVNKLIGALQDSENPDIQDVINTLQPYQSLAQVQKLMIQMIRNKEADRDLWEAYFDMISTQ